MNYVIGHIFTICGTIGNTLQLYWLQTNLFYFHQTDSLNDDVQSGKWETFGAAGGKLLQKILGTGVVTPVIKDAAADLTQALQGLASDTSQPSLDVSTITACLSSSTSQTLATGIQECDERGQCLQSLRCIQDREPSEDSYCQYH